MGGPLGVMFVDEDLRFLQDVWTRLRASWSLTERAIIRCGDQSCIY